MMTGCRQSPGSTCPRRGAAWSGYGAAWAATAPRAGSTACWVFTSHESRNMFSSCPPATPTRATRSPAYGLFTNHETRDTAFFSKHGFYRRGCVRGGATRSLRPAHCARRQVTVFLFTIVHHCSRLFGIVQRKILFLSQCPSPRRSLWRMPPPSPATRPVGFSRDTKHGFSLSLRRLQGEQPQARPTGFSRITRHESRITRHESRITAFMLLSLLSCALWRGIGLLWRGMGGRRPPRRQHGLLGFHQPRITQHGFSPALRRLQGEQLQARPTGFSRITKHESRPLCLSSHDFPRFPGISRYSSAPPPPGIGVRAPSAAAPAALRAASVGAKEK